MRDDFDDGGTPMWRARHAPRIIDVTPTTYRPRRRMKFGRALVLIFLAGYVGPFAILFFGVLGIGVWHLFD
jgi:hypothetical protein